MLNVINGGVHADNSIDLQSSWSSPSRGNFRRRAWRVGAELYHSLKQVCTSRARNRRYDELRPELDRARRRSSDPRGGRPAGHRDRSRSHWIRHERGLPGRRLSLRGPRAAERRDAGVLGGANRALPDRLARGSPRGRLDGWTAAVPPSSAIASSSSRRRLRQSSDRLREESRARLPNSISSGQPDRDDHGNLEALTWPE